MLSYFKKNVQEVQIVVLGASGVGKTYFCNQFTNDPAKNSLDYIATVDIVEKVKNPEPPNCNIKINLLDTPSDARFESKIKSILTQNNYVILMFDVSNRASFEKLQDYIEMADKHRWVKFLLIGNNPKSQTVQVESTEAKQYANSYCMHYVDMLTETNAKFENILLKLERKVINSNSIYKAPSCSRTTGNQCSDFILNVLIHLAIICTVVLPFFIICVTIRNFPQENKEQRGSYFKFYGESITKDPKEVELAPMNRTYIPSNVG